MEATQNSQAYTANLKLIRAVPGQDWLQPRNRTLFDFNAAYGKTTQPNTPTVKTDIIHFDGERDQYFAPRLYGFGAIAYDHNFSQGLDLQQTYGGGIGWTMVQDDNQELDLKASLNYIRLLFPDSALNENLVGSTFGEGYNRRLKHGILLVESIAFTPAWNNTNAFSAVGSATLTIPAYKRLNFSIGVLDTFLNNPPPGFRKNSFQLTTGLTYVLP